MCGECQEKQVKRRFKCLCCHESPANESNPCIALCKKQPPAEVRSCVKNLVVEQGLNQGKDTWDLATSDPYHVPGYTGHVPTLHFNQGETFGHATNRVLTSKMFKSMNERSPKLYLKTSHDCHPLHEPYHIPGYTGHVPGLKNMVGKSYGYDTHNILYSQNP